MEDSEDRENKPINNNKALCDICNSYDKYFLCDYCFKKYNSVYKQKKENLEDSEKDLSKKIDCLLSYNKEKSKKLNKKIYYEKYKSILLEKIKLEENKIQELEEESKKYEKLLIEQKDKISRLNSIFNVDTKQHNSLFDSYTNLTNTNIIINENENNDIDEIKNQIFEINSKIINSKKKYIFDLFEESFIKNKTIIKITDFFNIYSEPENNNDKNCLNFSIVNMQDKMSKEIKLDVFKIVVEDKNDIYLERFNSFFISMVSFLEKAYKRFKLKMPYKISFPKILNTNGFEYKIEIKKNEVDNVNEVNNAIKGYHLLNINYEYLVNYIFGDSIRIKYFFDMSFFITDKNEDLGSLKNIEEESKIKQGPKEIFGFEVLDNF